MQLYHGDCLDILPTFPARSVRAVVTDPPYGTKKTKWDESIDPVIFAHCLRICQDYALFFYSNTRLWHILGIIHALGYDTWVMPWYKPNAMGFERRFAPVWVPIVCAYKGNPPFWGQDFFSFPITKQKVDHPTPKPVPVVEWLVKRATDEGDTVLDPFMGSGTTGLACLNTGRQFIGIEKDAAYFVEAQKRIATAQTNLVQL